MNSVYCHISDYLCKPEDNVYNVDFTRFKIRDLETGTVLFEIAKPPSSGNWWMNPWLFCVCHKYPLRAAFCVQVLWKVKKTAWMRMPVRAVSCDTSSHQRSSNCARSVQREWPEDARRTGLLPLLLVFSLSLSVLCSHQCGVHGGRPAHKQLPHDRAALLPGPPAQELWLWLWFLHPQQSQHVRTHLRVPAASRRPQWVSVLE